MGDFRYAFDDVIARKVEIQIKFKNDINPQPIGPGKLEHVEIVAGPSQWLVELPSGVMMHNTYNQAEADRRCSEIPTSVVRESKTTVALYKITVPAMLQTPNGGAKKMLMPMIFDPDDVLWFSEGPLNADNEPAVITMGGNRSPGGIHL